MLRRAALIAPVFLGLSCSFESEVPIGLPELSDDARAVVLVTGRGADANAFAVDLADPEAVRFDSQSEEVLALVYSQPLHALMPPLAPGAVPLSTEGPGMPLAQADVAFTRALRSDAEWTEHAVDTDDLGVLVDWTPCATFTLQKISVDFGPTNEEGPHTFYSVKLDETTALIGLTESALRRKFLVDVPGGFSRHITSATLPDIDAVRAGQDTFFGTSGSRLYRSTWQVDTESFDSELILTATNTGAFHHVRAPTDRSDAAFVVTDQGYFHHWRDGVVRQIDVGRPVGGLAALGPGQAVFHASNPDALFVYTDGALEEEAFELSVPYDQLLSADLVPGFGTVVGTERGEILIRDENLGWRSLGLLESRIRVYSFRPFDGGFIYTAEGGVFGQYHPDFGLCPENNELLGVSHFLMHRFGDRFLFTPSRPQFGSSVLHVTPSPRP